MKESFTCYLDLTHINEELEDVECEIVFDIYTSRTNESDDPSEIEVTWIRCIDEDCPALLGQDIKVTQELDDQACERYINHVSGS